MTNDSLNKFLKDNGLPLPGAILYPPGDGAKGHRLLRYEIRSDGMVAVIDFNSELCWEVTWLLEQIYMCTYC